MKLVTLTTSLKELSELVPLLREFHFYSKFEILCLVRSSAESKLDANPCCHRRFREYVSEPLKKNESLKEKALVEAARRALLEERPDVILWPTKTYLKSALSHTVRLCGVGEYQLGQESESSLEDILENLREIDRAWQPAVPGNVTAPDFLESHWKRLEPKLQSPCLLKTTPQLARICRDKFPHIEFHTNPEHDEYPLGFSLLELSFSENPGQVVEELRKRSLETISLEPVNSPISGARYNYCHGGYDNEFALAKPDQDLKPHLGPNHQTVIWDARSGQAGEHPAPHPDKKYPAFFTTWPHEKADWTDRFLIPKGEKLKIVFADSQRVAASVFYHAQTVNRYTDSEAWALTIEPHPFVGPRTDDEHTFFTKGHTKPTPELEKVLREADCIVFFEDDDENSPCWSFPLAELTAQAAKVHLYIGYRVHSKTPDMARSGRTILTPLPIILRMYPQAQFYAGFPPLMFDEEEIGEPQSASDGVCRFLHTPSLPHWTTSRYPYHKDTEAFLSVARILKKKHRSGVEFHQVGGWNYNEVLEARKKCDVTFNQLRGFHGLSGDEAMILGRPCVQFFDQFNINRHLEYWGLDAEFPWVDCRHDTLADTFEELLLSPQKRAEIGSASRRFMTKYFSPQKGIVPLLYHCYGAARRSSGRGKTT
jgi:hypothetical protein